MKKTIILSLFISLIMTVSAIANGETDFEFTTKASIANFQAEGGNISWANGRLQFKFGQNGSLKTPFIDSPVGGRYSALLPVRSVVCARIKNSSKASKMRISFVTSEHLDYDDEKSQVFDISPRSNFKNYYFDLSTARNASGYIRGIRFEPIGTDGKLEIEFISFEREERQCEYVGKITSCIAINGKVEIKGTLAEKYSNQEVDIYETNISNYAKDISLMTKLCTVRANGTDFEAKLEFINGNMTRLSSHFAATVGGVMLDKMFTIENYRNFGSNQYEFSLPKRSADVTKSPYYAKGDGYTDDTDAIQQALDNISSKGGGIVVVPGDDSAHGRRYIITNIKLRNNTELHISKGAVIWQAPAARKELYKYNAVCGHDVAIEGVNWTHAALCHNLPLIQGLGVKNIRITGGGTVRSDDAGSECVDGVGAAIWTGCSSRIHVMPIAMFNCENIEVSDISLKRTNCYHMPFYACKNIYVANVTMNEVTCASGDGISAEIGTSNMIIDRCFLYSNDDGVVLGTSYNEPRGGHSWWNALPERDNCISNIEVRHSYIFGGHGLTFIAWGSDAPDMSQVEIKNISAFDCVFTGNSSSVGGWFDNPYNGGAFTNSATDDFSPVKNIRLVSNKYLNKTTLESVTPTNFISDCGIKSASNFVNGDFEHKDKTKTMGLSYWTCLGTETATGVTEDENGHFGFICAGNTSLCQGLFVEKATIRFTALVKTEKCTARLFIADKNGNRLAEEAVASPQFEAFSIEADLETDTYYFGIEHLTGNGTVYIDNSRIEKI